MGRPSGCGCGRRPHASWRSSARAGQAPLSHAEAVQAKEGSDAEMEEEEEESDEEVPETAKFESRSVAHPAAVNRVRCMHQQPGIVAVWGENCVVSVLNLSRTLTELAEGGGAAGGSKGKGKGPKPTQVRPQVLPAACCTHAWRRDVGQPDLGW